MPTALTWNDDEVQKIPKSMQSRLDVAAETIRARCIYLFGLPKSGAPVEKETKTREGGKTWYKKQFVAMKERGKALVGGKMVTFWSTQKNPQVTRRSAPGEPPAVQQANLRKGTTWERTQLLERRVGTNVPYGKYLEYGTPRIKPRPWLLRAAQESFVKIKQILGESIEGGTELGSDV